MFFCYYYKVLSVNCSCCLFIHYGVIYLGSSLLSGEIDVYFK